MSDQQAAPCTLQFDWIDIPAGACVLGDDQPAPAARPSEAAGMPIALQVYAIGRTPVTNAQYAAFVAASGQRPPAHWEGSQPPSELAQHPVTYVDWHAARAFCAWAGVRLPSEAEWEKAARGQDGRQFPWGDQPAEPLFANCAGRFGTTTPVGSFPAGASPYGALDMSGNVWEWTASCYQPYPARADDRQVVQADGPRVLRGGSYNHSADDMRCAARDPLYADACDEYIGFRVACDDPRAPTTIAFDWVPVPAGAFFMGTAEQAARSHQPQLALPAIGGPRHTVALPAYTITRTPVTNAQYAAFVSSSGQRAPAQWEGPQPPSELAQHPVTYIDWHAARAFCAWAGARLPSEAEWEHAARGDERRYPWGDQVPDQTRAWFDRPSGTQPVGSLPAGASRFGALDMAGNVWEWTASLHRPYPYDACDGREDPAAAGRRVLRGGSFRSDHARYLRCAFRSLSYPARRRDHIGFRMVRL